MMLNPLKKSEMPATASQDVGLGAQFSKRDLMYSQMTINKGEYDAARKRLIDEQLAPSQPPVQDPSPVQGSSEFSYQPSARSSTRLGLYIRSATLRVRPESSCPKRRRCLRTPIAKSIARAGAAPGRTRFSGAHLCSVAAPRRKSIERSGKRQE